MTDEDITRLRAKIDEVDDKIIALLNERSDFVREVGMTKKKRQEQGRSFIRSGREAALIRRIYAKLKDGSFPAAAAAQIWRMVIAASLSLESELTVSVHATDTQHEIYWLAREYFGPFIPIAKQPTVRRTLGDVLDGKAEVAALPLPDDSPEGSWWPRLPEGLKIFACMPFLLPANSSVKSLLVAKLEPEETGDDVTLLRIETDGDISQSSLKAVFDKHKRNVRWLAAESFPSGHRAHLVEMEGFINAQDAVIAALTQEIGASLLATSILGAYAAPIALTP